MKSFFGALLGLFLFCTPAFAYVPTWNPPARYDHPFRGKWRIHTVSEAYIFWHHPGALAFTLLPYPGSKVCDTYVPPVGGRYTARDIKTLIRHERGHCNGWPANHPA